MSSRLARKRRHLDVDAIQPVVQIEPELPLLDERGERPVRRDDDPRVDLTGAAPAHALDREILDRAQQLGLRRRRQVGHLVEEQRPFVRVLELPAPAADAGRRAVLDAEELRLEQRLDDRRAVDRDERPLAPPAQIVDLPRDELLARARLSPSMRIVKSVDSDPLDALAHLADRPARPDERRRAIAADARELRRASQRALDLQHQRGDMRRRFQQLARPSIERAAGIEHDFDPGALRQHDGRNVEDHDVAGGLLRRRPFTDRHRSRAHHGPEFLLEAFAHRRRTGRDRQGADDRLEERRRPSPTFRAAPVRAPRCRRDVQHIVHRVHLSSRPLCTTPAFQGQCQRRERAIVRVFARGWFRRPLADGASG